MVYILYTYRDNFRVGYSIYRVAKHHTPGADPDVCVLGGGGSLPPAFWGSPNWEMLPEKVQKATTKVKFKSFVKQICKT